VFSLQRFFLFKGGC